MKAPVATNRLNLALATKNTNSGPSSVASLNSGCGWVLSIMRPSKLFDPGDRLGKIPRGEWREIVDAFANADEMHRQFMFFRERDQNAAARGAVKLCHDKTGHAGGAVKCLNLRQCVLAHRRIEHQQHR